MSSLYNELVVIMEDDEYKAILEANIPQHVLKNGINSWNNPLARGSDVAWAVVAMAKLARKRRAADVAEYAQLQSQLRDAEERNARLAVLHEDSDARNAEIAKLKEQHQADLHRIEALTKSRDDAMEESRRLKAGIMEHVKDGPRCSFGFQTAPIVAEHQSTSDPSLSVWCATHPGNDSFPHHRWHFRRAKVEDLVKITGTINGKPAQLAGIDESNDGTSWRPLWRANLAEHQPAGGPFMVIGPRNEAPTIEHPTLEAATAECRRLCQRTPGKGMVVQIMKRMHSKIQVEDG